METGAHEQDDETTEQAESRMIHLTKREVEVLTLVIEGKSSKEVAEHIYISKRTVDYHLANIYKKLDVTNRVQAFREATRRNLLPVSGVFGIAL
ncbi:MAG: response regulator transcription factor [Akkermansiaceae bacterium]|nr:response regulator transcription factor [Armatimonadota bacterium]